MQDETKIAGAKSFVNIVSQDFNGCVGHGFPKLYVV